MTTNAASRPIHLAALVAFAIAVGCYALAMTSAAMALFFAGFAIECIAWALAIRRVRSSA